MNVLKKKTDLVKSVSFDFVIRLGFEPKTHSLEGCCSIQLSYRTDPCALVEAWWRWKSHEGTKRMQR